MTDSEAALLSPRVLVKCNVSLGVSGPDHRAVVPHLEREPG
jgi:hypothetical protein